MTMRFLATAALAAVVGLVGAAPARADVYSFTLGGFTQGGTLTVDFTGSDLDSNGAITAAVGVAAGSAPNEVTALSATWSGNAVVPAFTLSITDSDQVDAGLVYTLGAPDFWSGSALIIWVT